MLPAEGRHGDPPEWPIRGQRPSPTVMALWAQLWSTPQADAWETMGPSVARVVARYTRKLLDAEKSTSTAAMQGEVRQLEDRLGLTPMAMRRLMWEIAPPVEAGATTPGGGDQPVPEVAQLDEYRDLYGTR